MDCSHRRNHAHRDDEEKSYEEEKTKKTFNAGRSYGWNNINE